MYELVQKGPVDREALAVLRTADDAIIPNDRRDTDRQAAQARLGAGNTPAKPVAAS